MRVDVGARTDVGRARTVNQDVFLVDEPLYGVADGMGGHQAGDVASATAVETVRKEFERAAPSSVDELAAFLNAANAAVWERSHEDSAFEGMGTTFTLVHLDGDLASVAHVGDSRAYLMRDGQLEQITEDHTLVQRMVQEGRLSREQAAHHPQRNVITRALGADQDLEVDRTTIQVKPGDRLLICSDGLNSMIDDAAIAELLASGDDADTAARALVDAANEAGGEDNITVVVLRFEEGDPDRSAPAPVVERIPTEPRQEPVQVTELDEDDGPRFTKPALLVGLGLILLVGALIGGRALVLANAWFVGADDSGTVTIYKGIPEDVLGLSMSDTVETSDLQVDELPAFLRADVLDGIKRGSLDEARATIADLERRTLDFGTNATDEKK